MIIICIINALGKTNVITLADLRKGDNARIESINTAENSIQRLMTMDLVCLELYDGPRLFRRLSYFPTW